MGSRKYTDELEDFLADAVESHRMYPSDKVWQRISKTIQPSYKWPALTFCAIVIGALYMLTIIFVQPSKDLWNPDYAAPQTAAANPAADILAKQTASDNALVESTIIESVITAPKVQVPYKAGKQPVIAAQPVAEEKEVKYESNLALLTQLHREMGTSFESVLQPEFVYGLPQVYLLPGLQLKENEPHTLQRNLAVQSALTNNSGELNTSAGDASDNTASSALATIGLSADYSAPKPSKAINPKTTADATPQLLTQRDLLTSEIMNRKKQMRKSPWAIRFYATPSVSFRTYFDNKSKNNDVASASLQGPIAPNWINSASMFVRQQARVGLELGTAVSYDVSRNFKLRVGAQVNYRQFSADAFRGQSEKALILLENSGKVDSVFTMTSLLNQNGKAETTLTNRFVEVAVPVGFDVEVASGRIGSFYVSGTLQPTYTLYSQGYLLSTDYTRYVDRQDLFNKFNLNTSLEAYLQIPGNGVQWQIGPQIRYQATPGTVEGYGIRQHLVDYGLKVGVMKTLR